jgi:hypothetical protein
MILRQELFLILYKISQIAFEISERQQSDAANVQHIDEELANLQSLVSVNSYSSEAVAAVDEASKIIDSDVAVPVNTAAMTGGELTEYMLRIRNRRALNLKDDSNSENRAAIDGQNRRNWSLDGEHNNGPFRETASNSQHASNNRKDERGGNMHEGRSITVNGDRAAGQSKSSDHERYFQEHNSNRGRERESRGASSTSASVKHVVEEGEDAEDSMDQDDNVLKDNNRQSKLKPDDATESELAVAEDDYVPEETEIEGDGEVDEEEDEAELLLAALGGRKH